MQKGEKKDHVFGWLWTKSFLLLNAIFRKIGKHYLCSEGKKTRIFVDTICFSGKCHFFFVTIQNRQNTTKNRGFSRHRGKPKMALLVTKCRLEKGPWKGVWLSVIHKRCVLLKTFLKISKHGFAEIKERKLKRKHKELSFCYLFFLGGGVCSLCFLFFCFVEMAQKGYFPVVLEVFVFLLCFPKRPVFNRLVFFLFCLFSLFSFVFPFKNFTFLCFLSSTPFWKTCLFFGLFCPFFCLFLC